MQSVLLRLSAFRIWDSWKTKTSLLGWVSMPRLCLESVLGIFCSVFGMWSNCLVPQQAYPGSSLFEDIHGCDDLHIRSPMLFRPPTSSAGRRMPGKPVGIPLTFVNGAKFPFISLSTFAPYCASRVQFATMIWYASASFSALS